MVVIVATPAAPFVLFAALLSASVLCAAINIRSTLARTHSPISDLRVFASPIALCIAPSLIALALTMNNTGEQVYTSGPTAASPLWMIVGVPALAACCVFGLALLRVGPRGAFTARPGWAGKAVWIALAFLAPTIALLDTISIVDIFFLLLASAAALAMDRSTYESGEKIGVSNTFSGGLARALCLIAGALLSAAAAYSVTQLPHDPTASAGALTAIFIALVVCLLLPLSFAVAMRSEYPRALSPLIGDVVLLVLLLGCTGLIAREVWLEIASMMSQLRANLDAGLAPVFFRTREMEVSGFARVAPELFLVIPLAGIAICASHDPTGASSAAHSHPWAKLLGVALVAFALIGLSWKLSWMSG